MLKLMLVDDEPLIIKGLEKIINWKRCGFEIIAKAYNGEEALKLAERLRPHVIVTDVRMPGMNGLELVKAINDQMLNIKFIILSGYDEFSYAQTAIKNGCLDYILKPVKCEEFESILVKLRGKIESEMEKEKTDTVMKEKLALSIPVLREKILSDIMMGNLKSEQEIEENLKQLEIKVSSNFIIMTMEVDNFHSAANLMNNDEKKVLSDLVFEITNSILTKKDCGLIFKRNSDKFTILLSGNEYSINIRYANDTALLINRTVKEALDRTVTIGLSSHYREYGKMTQAFKESEISLKYKIIVGSDRVIQFDEIQHGEKMTFSYPFNIEKGLFKCIQKGDQEECNKLINQLFANINQYNLISPDYIYKICTELLLMTSRMVTEAGGDIGEIFNEDIISIKEIMKNESICDLRQWFRGIFEKITSYLNNLKSNNTKGIINDIKHYINENYNKDISLNDLASHFYINPSYLSQLFKNETGQNLFDYITDIRIFNAKKLLKNKDLKIYEISIMAGYPDSKYFSQVFKKATGLSPKEYRGE